MTFDQYKNDFTEIAIESGYSEKNIVDCLKYAKSLFLLNVPVVYNTSHFSALVGYNKTYLKRAVLHNKYFYKEFEIIKKNGKKRKISEPLPSLKEIQTWILDNILYKIEVSKYAKAYIPEMHLKQNVIFHRGQKKVFVIDIENFFTSISEKALKEFSFHLVIPVFYRLYFQSFVVIISVFRKEHQQVPAYRISL